MKTLFLFVSFTVFAPNFAWADSFSAQAVYDDFCSACHGYDGEGISADIPDFGASDSVLKKDSETLVKSLINGVRLDDGTEVMPPFGGADNFSKEQSLIILKYLRENFGS